MSDDPIFLRSLRLCESSFSQMFIAYCVVYFSPSRKGRKDYLQYQIIRGGQFVVPKMYTLLYSTLLKLKHKEMSPAQYRAHYYKGSNN